MYIIIFKLLNMDKNLPVLANKIVNVYLVVIVLSLSHFTKC